MGKKTFTLAPVKSGYDDDCVMINRSTLQDLLRQIGLVNCSVLKTKTYNANNSEDSRRVLLDEFRLDAGFAAMPGNVHYLVNKALESPSCAYENNLVLSDEFGTFLFDFFFHIKPSFDRPGRRFAYAISTNGETASVLFLKNAPPTPNPADGNRHVSGQRLLDPVEVEWRAATWQAIDPGYLEMYSWATKFSDGQYTSGNASSGEYQHKSQMKKSARWHENLRARFPQYDAIIDGMPSMKTNNLQQLSTAITYRLTHYNWLFGFYRGHGFTKWRFTTFRFSQKAIDAVAKKLVDGSNDVLFGIGDFSVSDGFRAGHRIPPLGRLGRAVINRGKNLNVRVKVIPLNEYNTSQMCCYCGARLCESKASRYVYTLQENGEWDKVPEVKRTRKVLYCNTGCKKFWDRDHNSSWNHMDILESVVMGLPWPARLRRGQ